MGEGICDHCMDVICDPGVGQLAGISVGMLQKITVQSDKRRDLRILYSE